MIKRVVIVLTVSIIGIGYFTETLYAKQETLNWGLNITAKNKKPGIDSEAQSILDSTNAKYVGDELSGEVYLTFDTGYETGNTAKILDVLLECDVTAVFFITSHFIESHPDLVIRMVDDGHLVGNHTAKHPDITGLSTEELTVELNSLEQQFYDLTGERMDPLFRPPMGKYNQSSLDVVSELGYTTLFWSLAYVDWEIHNQRGWEHSYTKVMTRIHPGAIILMHTVSTDNAKALEKIITDVKSEGYRFGSPKLLECLV